MIQLAKTFSKAWWLTTGADAFVGGASGDVFNALSVKADGAPASTLSAFDSIDGGAGKDTLNIYTTAAENLGLTGATVKNVETINVYNTAAAGAFGDASKFVGATAINQIGANAASVINLAAGTTAGFNATTQAAINVQAAVAAATATVALTGVAEATDLAVTAAAGGVLNSVTVSGTRVDATPTTPIDNLDLAITAGKDVESVSIKTSVNSTLTVGNEAGSTKVLSTVDASASTGAVTYVGGATVATIKTGAANDTATLAFAGTTTVNAASLSTGAGNDVLTVNVTKGAATAVTATVDAGEGNDTINLAITAGVAYNVTAGAGNDTVVITAGTVKTTDKVDGGEGTDIVSLSLAAPATLVADDYIVFNKVLTNFETLKLTTNAATLDASLLAATYSTVDLASGSVVTKVGAQSLVANGGLTATATGTDVVAATKVYAGTLNITDKATGTVTANADKVALTVDASTASATVTLAGDSQSATANLIQALNTGKTAYVGNAAFVLDTSVANANLTSVTLTGNGAATVTNADGTKLANVDASALASTTFDGKAAAGLTYSSVNTAAETIKLGAGIDALTIGASTFGKVDVVTGLNLVLNQAGTALAATSDTVSITGVALTAASKGFVTSQTDLELALKDAAAYSAANAGIDLAFQQGGNTYVFHDAQGAGVTTGTIDAADTVVQLSGLVNLDALIIAA